MKTTQYDKALEKSGVIVKKERRGILKSIAKPFIALNSRLLSPIGRKYLKLTNGLKSVPFPILFTIFMIIIILSVLTANSIRDKTIAKSLTLAYPDATIVPETPDGKALYKSPLDVVVTQFYYITKGVIQVFMFLKISSFLKTIWVNNNSRKPQVLKI